MMNISKTLFRRLSFVIPSTNLVMKEMIAPYAMDRDGYACLWSLMRRSCDFMRPEPEGWGPPWPTNGTVIGTPEKYVISLQSWCSTTNIRNNKKYSHYQQSKEMLYQAALAYKPAIATKLDTELTLWYSNNDPNATLPEAWRITGIIDKFSDYENVALPIIPGTPSINRLNDNRNAYNPGKKKFELKPIQCPCCKCAGHQIGEQVCRIGAQYRHIQAYADKNPTEFKENAMRYETMNRPKVIKMVSADNLLLTSVDDFLDESEARVSVYHPDSSEE